MIKEQTRIIHKDDLPLGGFAGIVETRMVMNPIAWSDAKGRTDISHGLDDFLYLATGYFKANDGAPMHPHKDVDIVSFIPKGAVGHEGTMGDGTSISGPGVQVQRAGTGIKHSEFSLNGEAADLVQIWFKPPSNGLEPAYKDIVLEKNKMTTVLGGNDPNSFHSTMTCQIGLLEAGQTLNHEQPYIMFLQKGTALINGQGIKAGDLVEGKNLDLKTLDECALVLIHSTEKL